jgi:hypothetical protein
MDYGVTELKINNGKLHWLVLMAVTVGLWGLA